MNRDFLTFQHGKKWFLSLQRDKFKGIIFTLGEPSEPPCIYRKKERTNMFLCDGAVGETYSVQQIDLPATIERRLEALGMTKDTKVSVLKSKGKGILIIRLRGTRIALGRNITKNILVRAA